MVYLMFIFNYKGLNLLSFFFFPLLNKLLVFACLFYYIIIFDQVACIIIFSRQIYTSIVWFCLIAHIEITFFKNSLESIINFQKPYKSINTVLY